jgi:putative endonuclease
MTQNIEERIKRHNDGRERTTKFYTPFELIYSEVCETRVQARIREKYWKSGVGKEKLRKLRKVCK